MKNYLKLIVCFLLCVLFGACSKLIQKHEDFINNLKTKSDVVRLFGYPNQYRNQGSTVAWLYIIKKQKKMTRQDPSPLFLKLKADEGEQVQDFHDVKGKYVLITLQDDLVVDKRSEGVDFTTRKPRPILSILLGAGLGLGVAFGLFAIAYSGGW